MKKIYKKPLFNIGLNILKQVTHRTTHPRVVANEPSAGCEQQKQLQSISHVTAT